jgi:hypothetical protein
MHLLKYIKKYQTPITLLHVSEIPDDGTSVPKNVGIL